MASFSGTFIGFDVSSTHVGKYQADLLGAAAATISLTERRQAGKAC